ncbi:hypothetical protein [Viridibacterium curvum]|uniref:Uncharacterized protein n=1 Tax=Viridibacterium curvum TaxID=1101404 RepID=A0ABP9QQA7_9RHOO
MTSLYFTNFPSLRQRHFSHGCALMRIVLCIVLSFAVSACQLMPARRYLSLSEAQRLQDRKPDYSRLVAEIGEPDECWMEQPFRACRWGDKERNLSVRFLGELFMFGASSGLN